jgi:hypothetical protein
VALICFKVFLHLKVKIFFSRNFFCMFYSLSLYVQLYKSFKNNFCILYEIGIELHFLIYKYLVVPATCVEKTILSPNKLWLAWQVQGPEFGPQHRKKKKNCDWAVVENHLILYVYIYFWTVYCAPMIHLSIFIPIPHTVLSTVAL